MTEEELRILEKRLKFLAKKRNNYTILAYFLQILSWGFLLFVPENNKSEVYNFIKYFTIITLFTGAFVYFHIALFYVRRIKQECRDAQDGG